MKIYSQKGKYFPHDILDYEDLIKKLFILQKEEWEARYIILTWLSMVIINPFPLESLEEMKFEGLIEKLKENLSESGKPREATSILLSKLLTRPDLKKELASFFKWCTLHMNSKQMDDSYLVRLHSLI